MLLDYMLRSSFITNGSGEIWRCKRTFTELLSLLDVDTKTLLDRSLLGEASFELDISSSLSGITKNIFLPSFISPVKKIFIVNCNDHILNKIGATVKCKKPT